MMKLNWILNMHETSKPLKLARKKRKKFRQWYKVIKWFLCNRKHSSTKHPQNSLIQSLQKDTSSSSLWARKFPAIHKMEVKISAARIPLALLLLLLLSSTRDGKRMLNRLVVLQCNWIFRLISIVPLEMTVNKKVKSLLYSIIPPHDGVEIEIEI